MNILNWWDRQSPIQALTIVMGVFLVAAGVAAIGRVPDRPRSTTSFIMILTTPAPTQPLPTADMRLAEENAALRARVAELERASSRNDKIAEPQPGNLYNVNVSSQQQPTPAEPGYTAETDQGPVFVPDSATPVPEGASYDGPFLAPAQPTVPPNARQYCDGFGDWRDYDEAYATSPVCNSP